MEGSVITLWQFILTKSFDYLHSTSTTSLLFSVIGIWIVILNLTVQCEKLYETKK